MIEPRDDYTKWRQRKTNIGWYHLYVESKKYNTHELINKIQTDPQTLKQIYGYQGERWGVKNN